MSGEVIYDNRMLNRRLDTEREADRKIRKAIRDGSPPQDVIALIDAEMARLDIQCDEAVRSLIRFRIGREPNEDEMAAAREKLVSVRERFRLESASKHT